MKKLMLVVLVILSGCYQPHWYKPDTTYQQLKEDSDYCKNQLIVGASRDIKIIAYENCMIKKGYRTESTKTLEISVPKKREEVEETECEGTVHNTYGSTFGNNVLFYVDGRFLGNLSPGECVEISLPKGEHVFKSQVGTYLKEYHLVISKSGWFYRFGSRNPGLQERQGCKRINF